MTHFHVDIRIPEAIDASDVIRIETSVILVQIACFLEENNDLVVL